MERGYPTAPQTRDLPADSATAYELEPPAKAVGLVVTNLEADVHMSLTSAGVGNATTRAYFKSAAAPFEIPLNAIRSESWHVRVASGSASTGGISFFWVIGTE